MMFENSRIATMSARAQHVRTLQGGLRISRELILQLSLAFFVVLIPFQWYRLPVPGRISINWLSTIVLLAAMICFSHYRSLFATSVRFFQRAPVFHFSFFAYAMVYVAAGLFHGAGYAVAFKTVTQLIRYFAFGAAIEGLSTRALSRTMLIVVPLSLVIFTLYAQWVFMSLGTSLPAALQKALMTGEHSKVTNQVVRTIVNFEGGEVRDWRSEDEVSGSVRNSLGSYVVFCFFATLSFLPTWRMSGLGTKLLAVCGLALGPLLLLAVLMSRSGIISLVAGLGLSALILLLRSADRQQLRTRFFNAMLVFGIMASVLTVIIALMGDNQILVNNLSRFSEITRDPRVAHYSLVIRDIAKHIWVGNGPNMAAADGLQVHNLFLGAWFQVGIAGLIVTVVMWGSICLQWLASPFQFVRLHSSYVSYIFAPALMASPIFRRMVAGDCGRFVLVEMFAVALFLVLCSPSSASFDNSIQYPEAELTNTDAG